jgi:hypothetical protein
MFQPLKKIEEVKSTESDVLHRLSVFNLDSYGVGARFEKKMSDEVDFEKYTSQPLRINNFVHPVHIS